MLSADISTQRLRLVAPTVAILEADLAKDDRLLKQFLQVQNIHRSKEARSDYRWPTNLFEAILCQWQNQYPKRFADGWGPWYICCRMCSLMGVVWFFEPQNGEAEISIEFLAQFQGNGYAEEAVNALIAHAFQTDSVAAIFAKTTVGPDEDSPEIKLLCKVGFQYESKVGSYWIWKRRRP